MDTPKKKILVVDDSRDMSKVMSEMLIFKGYDTIVKMNGRSAITAALAEHPDLILLDLNMPDLSGFEVLRELRKDSWGKTAKVLMLTAADGVNDIPPDIGLSSNDYLIKSIWGIEEVEKKVRQKIAEA